MDITGTCSEGKEKLLTGDYNLTLPHISTNSRRARCVNLTLVLAVVSVTACVISCICAVYCHSALAEIEFYRHDITKPGVSAPLVTPTEASNLARDEQDTYLDSKADSFELPGEESEIDEYGIDDFEDDDEYTDDTDDISADGSGVGFETGTSDSFDQTGRVRTRRASAASAAAADKCKDKCKGKNGKKMRRCMKKCQEGGTSINLPAAHFECLSENDISKLVRVEANEYIIKGTCKDVQELDGILCSNRTFYPEKKNEPLKVFKPSEWVESKSSPVRFAGSVAEAKSSGIYLVYAQAYIGGSEPGKSITIVQKRHGAEISALSCNNGVHPDHYNSTSTQMQTCSVLGLMNVQNGDSVEVQKSSATLDITLDKDKTYFGVVQLSQIALKQNKNRKRKNKD